MLPKPNAVVDKQIRLLPGQAVAYFSLSTSDRQEKPLPCCFKFTSQRGSPRPSAMSAQPTARARKRAAVAEVRELAASLGVSISREKTDLKEPEFAALQREVRGHCNSPAHHALSIAREHVEAIVKRRATVVQKNHWIIALGLYL